jgi:type I restriction enzyme S subunit
MSFKPAEIGNVPSAWYVEDLRFFLDLITYGFTNPMPDAEDGPWKLTAKDVVNGRINYATARRTTWDAFSSKLTDKSRPKIGDVLLTKDGSIGRVAVVDQEGLCINQSVALLRPNNLIRPQFLKYLLLSPYYQGVMEGDSDGSTIKHIYITRVDKMQVAVPSLDEQLKFLEVFGTVDDRISLLRDTNTTLEYIAQALFKSWFVDFDPVRAKQQDRAPDGIDDATAALFPDSFEESELGLVPKGWRVGTLNNFAVYQNGYAFKTKDWQDTGYPVVKIGNVKPGVIDISGCSWVSNDVIAGLDRFLLKRGDLLVGMTGYVGETGLVPDLSPPAYLNQRVGRICTKVGIADLGFIYCVVRNPQYKSYAEERSHGSAQANVSGADLMAYPVVIPTSEVLYAFNQTLNLLIEKILTNHSQAQTLATLRDTLLPRLISGQLRLPDAEALIKAAAV